MRVPSFREPAESGRLFWIAIANALARRAGERGTCWACCGRCERCVGTVAVVGAQTVGVAAHALAVSGLRAGCCEGVVERW